MTNPTENEPAAPPALTLCPVNDLLGKHFIIPSYQRGYRWTPRQVTELLDDIHEFQLSRNESPKEAFYCLQPIVVLPKGDAWELIDGQQRLTTLALILRYLSPLMEMLGKGRYSLSYETRPHSQHFLDELDEARSGDNIDFYNMYEAYKAIDGWFKARDGNVKLHFIQCLLDAEHRNVQVIWYQLPPGDDPIEAFVRLNVGKIPLTNGELIRALFLRDRNFPADDATPSKVQIAHEWDAIEKRLQADDLWYFIHAGPSPYPTRIEFLFEIMVRKEGFELRRGDDYATFVAYLQHFLKPAEELEGGATPAKAQQRQVELRWREVKQLALRLEEWFQDRTLYHLVGHWISVCTGGRKPMMTSAEVVVELLRERSARSRSSFERYLRERIYKQLLDGDLKGQSPEAIAEAVSEYVTGQSYPDDQSHSLRATLLLFNLATLLRNTGSNLRFPFDLYKKEDWDIEHIRSVKIYRPGRADDQKSWLGLVLTYWDGCGEEDTPLYSTTTTRRSLTPCTRRSSSTSWSSRAPTSTTAWRTSRCWTPRPTAATATLCSQ